MSSNLLHNDQDEYQILEPIFHFSNESITPSITLNTSINKRRKPINVIFDLDNTLVCAVPFEELNELPKNLPFQYADFGYSMNDLNVKYRSFARPFLQQQLTYISQFANIAIWTAATK